VPVFVLVAENVAVFFRHYFRGFGFPWDFVGSYYAVPAYWTEALSRGSLAEWMPFQSMGYPFRLHLQSGLWYPPLWVFPILKIPYTLPAAVALQALHVLVGALGMYALLRTAVRTRREALVGAFVFQLFGGFYSNAEHVDIVRAFAFTPWWLACLVPPRADEDEHRLPLRVLALPLAVWTMAVGGYPGNLISTLFLTAAFLGFALTTTRESVIRKRRWAVASAGAVLLGLLMSAAALGPGWIHRRELERHRVAAEVQRASLSLSHLPGLVEDIRGMPGDPSMSSTFVGFAVVCGLCLLDRRALRRLGPFVLLLLLSAAMAAGDNTPIYRGLRRLIPPLGYSRFPSSDYRCAFAILAILLAAAGWKTLRRRPLPFWRWIPAAAFGAWAVWSTERRVPLRGAALEAAGAFALAAAALLFWRRARGALRPWATALLLVAASLDATRVLSRLETWSVPDLMRTCRVYQPTLARLADAGTVVSPSVFVPRRGPRPARTEGEAGYRASGYLTGEYDLGDFGGPVLRARELAAGDPASLAYASRAWLPVVVEGSPPGDGNAEIPDLSSRLSSAKPDSRVEQVLYGADRVDYRLRLERPALVVENEIYFPGWSARVAGPDGTARVVEAMRVNGVWRGWPLPAGEYELNARFRLRGVRILALLTLAAWSVWTAWVVARFRGSWRALRPVRL